MTTDQIPMPVDVSTLRAEVARLRPIAAAAEYLQAEPGHAGCIVEYEYEYGTDEAAEADGLLQPGTQMYDETAVAGWVRAHVKAPVWRWYRYAPGTEFGEDDDEDARQWLVAAAETDPAAFFGAVIDLVETERT